MKRKIEFGWLAAGLLALAAAAPAQVTQVGAKYQFRARYIKGQTLQYEMSSAATPPGAKQPIKALMPLKTTVVDVKNGIATMKATAGPAMMNGRPLGQANTVEMQVNEHGKIVNQRAPGLPQTGQPLPDRPLAIGESYTNTSKINQGGLALDVKQTLKLMGIKTVGGRRVAQFAIAIQSTGPIAMNGHGTCNIDMADGQLYSMNSSQNVTVKNGQQSISMKNDVSIVRK